MLREISRLYMRKNINQELEERRLEVAVENSKGLANYLNSYVAQETGTN